LGFRPIRGTEDNINAKEETPMNRDDLTKELIGVAELTASGHGMHLGPGADADIRRFATVAATEMFDLHKGAEPPIELTDRAKAGFKRLVDEMVLAASEIPGYQAAYPGIIGEQTLSLALSRLCPLFPIC
jgi:hypothetical protein